MNRLTKLSYRLFQKIMYAGMLFMPWRQPKLLQGEGALFQIAGVLTAHGKKHPLLVCDKAAVQRGAIAPLCKSLTDTHLAFTVYDGVLPNPTIEQAEQGVAVYNNGCDCIVAFGGGSVLDCAKLIGARIARPKKSVAAMKGLLKVRKKLPLFIAIPTTAGTGSEVTVAAVVTDEAHQKYAVNDFSLIPHYAVLDAQLTAGLPPFLTATTGMDALTHAVESYIGRSNTPKTKRQAEEAVRLIFENLPKAYADGTDLAARQNMQKAAYLAGQAFTRAYVGYVHALAHALGGMYNVPHGLANSILLPVVLFAYGKAAQKKLARLADIVGAGKGESESGKAQAFIGKILQLNEDMSVPSSLSPQYVLNNKDIELMAKAAVKEAHPLYPVPRIFDIADLIALYQEIV